jgi:hypothetical protein
MGVPTSEVIYTLATTRRGDHEVHNGHVVALEKKFLLQHKMFVKICYITTDKFWYNSVTNFTSRSHSKFQIFRIVLII